MDVGTRYAILCELLTQQSMAAMAAIGAAVHNMHQFEVGHSGNFGLPLMHPLLLVLLLLLLLLLRLPGSLCSPWLPGSCEVCPS